MNESPIRRFCESPQRKLIVIIGTTVLGLLVMIPLVDGYLETQESYRTLTDELDLSRQTAKTLPGIEEEARQQAGKLRELEARAVSERTVSSYRSKLVDLIRSVDCRVRQLDVSSPTYRPWLENDDPLQQNMPKGMAAKKTPFTLEKRSVTLLVDGTMDNIQGFLDKLNKDQTFAYPHRLDLHTNGRRGGAVTLEMEMWLFALGRHKAS